MLKTLPLIALTASGFAATACTPDAPHCYSQDECERCYCLGPASIIANSPVRPLTCDGDFSIFVAGLYWKGIQDELEYGIETNVVILDEFAEGEINNLIDARYLLPDFKWNFGFKVGLGYSSPCDGWDIALVWTSFDGRASSHDEAERESAPPAVTTSVAGHELISLFSNRRGKTSDFDAALGVGLGDTLPGPVVTDIRTFWKLDLDLVDLSLGREFWLSKYLTFRPFIALRYASLDQDFNIESSGGEFSLGDENLNDFVEIENDFWGVGPLAGFDTRWHVGCGWSLYGNLGASILYGRFEFDEKEHTRQAESPFSKTRVLETEDSFRASRGGLELALGIEYAALICDCKYGLSARLGWEQHLFFHQNQIWRVIRLGADPSAPDLPNNTGQNDYSQKRGTLSTQGWTLSFRFDF